MYQYKSSDQMIFHSRIMIWSHDDVMMTSSKVDFFRMASSSFADLNNCCLLLRGTIWFRAWSMISCWAFSVVCALFVEFLAFHIQRTDLHCASLKKWLWRHFHDFIITSFKRTYDIDSVGFVSSKWECLKVHSQEAIILTTLKWR